MTSLKKLDRVIHQVKTLLDALPSREEIAELVEGIDKIVRILTQINSSLSNLPSFEEIARAKESLEKLEFILSHNPLLRNVLTKKRKRSSKPSPSLEISRERVLKELQSFFQLSESELRNRLTQGKRYSKKFLQSLLSELGRRVPSKATKKEMIDQIAVAIVTRRTYKGIRGD